MTDPDDRDGRPADSDALKEPFDPRTVSPDDAFRVLGNRTRLSILRALWNTDEEPLPFAELERETAVETDNFAYHLDQLVGHFVRRSDDGYALRYAGETVMRSIVAGLFSEGASLDWLAVDSGCPYCDGSIEMRYHDDQLTVRCTSCGGVVGNDEYPPGTFMSYGVPPAGLVGRSPSAVLESAHVLYDSKITPMMNGVCPECAATVDHSIRICDSHSVGEDGLCSSCDTRFSVWVDYACELCAYRRSSPPWFSLLTEASVIAFYHEHSDFDRSVPFSKLTRRNAPYVRSISQSVVSREPLRIRIEFPLETAVLRVTIDETLEIRSVERVDPA
ncbi:winged helix-turn-helix domain-containing protein [Halorarius halobius]|uniref:winged helix-turn-helix domain-containing protein n=1 Tax=Halorarius halobius TaxID=2962671 RepID=UPI0020CF0AAB|nr:helix-turn-helix domain-containing protein [Halorarius halobius]